MPRAIGAHTGTSWIRRHRITPQRQSRRHARMDRHWSGRPSIPPRDAAVATASPIPRATGGLGGQHLPASAPGTRPPTATRGAQAAHRSRPNDTLRTHERHPQAPFRFAETPARPRKPQRRCIPSRRSSGDGVNRPGLVGVSIVWKRGWTHAEGHHPGEADHASLQP